uniref:WD_REPEATS_REGION domain-containing protein n=1 Tax=Nippostrongylus brasiliensis TaxID=27835 RepID=A0A0N4YJ64_NIPBR
LKFNFRNSVDLFDSYCTIPSLQVFLQDLTRNSDPRIDATLTGHFSRVNACVYRPKYQQLYTAGADRNLLCWAPESERNRFHMEAETAVKKATMDDWSDDD